MTGAPQTIGSNNPPEPIEYQTSYEEIDGLMVEARNWLDGTGITSQGQADAVAMLLAKLRTAVKTADDRRKAELAPHDEVRAEIQTRWNQLIGDNKTSGKGRAVLAMELCRRVLTPWEVQEREKREAEAKRLREEAEAKAREARLAAQLSAHTDIEARETADALAREAAKATKAANKAESATSATKGAGRAMAVTKRPVAKVTDVSEFAEWLFRSHPDRFSLLLTQAAQELANAKVAAMPGVHIDMVESVR